MQMNPQIPAIKIHFLRAEQCYPPRSRQCAVSIAMEIVLFGKIYISAKDQVLRHPHFTAVLLLSFFETSTVHYHFTITITISELQINKLQHQKVCGSK